MSKLVDILTYYDKCISYYPTYTLDDIVGEHISNKNVLHLKVDDCNE